MAAKDDSVSLWLHNKLGSSTHLWSFSSTVVSQYSLEKLHSIRDCFCTLDSLVKLKFFLSLFHIPKRCIEEFKPIIEEIIENTITSCLDQWVLSIAMFVKTFWLTQSLDTQVEYDLDSFKEALGDLKQILKECMDTESGCERSRFLLPLEFDYLNKEARFNVLPNTSSFTNEFLFSLTADDNSLFTKHFNLFKPPKAVNSLEDLKNKSNHYSKSKTTKSIIHTGLNSFAEYSSEATNRFVASKKTELGIGMGTDPYSSKIFSNSSNSLSSYGSHGKSQGSSSFFKRSMLTNTASTTITGKSSTPKRNVGIKLLDAQEQSVTPKEAKRKRKEQEKEMLKKQKQELERSEKEEIDQMHKQENTKSEETGVGLINPNNNKEAFSEEPASYFHSVGQHETTLENFQTKLIDDYKPKDIPQIPQELESMAQFEMPGENNPPNPSHNPFNPQLNLPASNQSISSINEMLFQPNNTNNNNHQQSSLQNNSPMLSSNLQSFQDNFNSSSFNLNRANNNINSNEMNSIPNFINNQFKSIQQQLSVNNQNQQQQQQQQSSLNPSPNKLEAFTTQSSIAPPMFTKQNALSFLNPGNENNQLENQRMILQQQQQLQLQQQQEIQRKQQAQQQSLSLTREQMLQAQEMFSNSNQLSRPDKAQILGFIAGSRENPRPEQGSLIAIKLNEANEIILTGNGQQQHVIAECYFEMNYDSGDYRKVKKYRSAV